MENTVVNDPFLKKNPGQGLVKLMLVPQFLDQLLLERPSLVGSRSCGLSNRIGKAAGPQRLGNKRRAPKAKKDYRGGKGSKKKKAPLILSCYHVCLGSVPKKDFQVVKMVS